MAVGNQIGTFAAGFAPMGAPMQPGPGPMGWAPVAILGTVAAGTVAGAVIGMPRPGKNFGLRVEPNEADDGGNRHAVVRFRRPRWRAPWHRTGVLPGHTCLLTCGGGLE